MQRKLRHALLPITIGAVAAACGGQSIQGIDAEDAGSQDARVADGGPRHLSTNDAGGPEASQADARPTDGGAADAGECRTTGLKLDTYKSCHFDNDCTFAIHSTNCCGSFVYVGIAKARLAEFELCESAWASHFPPCGCASGPPKTEDGKEVPWNSDAGAYVAVTCELPMNGAVGACLTKRR